MLRRLTSAGGACTLPALGEAGLEEVTTQNCTTGVAGPVLDGIGSGLSLLAAPTIAGMNDWTIRPADRSFVVGFYTASAVTLGLAAAVGVNKANSCREYESNMESILTMQKRLAPKVENYPSCRAELPDLTEVEECVQEELREEGGDGG